MTHEIIYTSAPQGLKPGSKGFCTVVATAGIPKNLLERLESLSGYHHVFMTQEVGGLRNPVNFAHYRLTLGGRRYDVLSRVCDAGLDYTQRTNKLAHHVALEAAEVAAAIGGPACVLDTRGFSVERWDGRVQTLPSGRRPPVQDCPMGICRAWEQATGDAGWAGVLAESALQGDHTMSILFRPGLDALPLLVEALSLLPSEKRWEVTFSTYYSKTGGMDCHWRFVLDGTTEATALRRDPRARCIDLCKPLGPASGGELVTMARTGLAVQRAEAKRSAAGQRVAPDRSRPALPAAPSPELSQLESPPDYHLAPPELPAASGPANGWQPSPRPLAKRGNRNRGLPIGLKAVLAILILIMVAGASFWLGKIGGKTDGELRGKSLAENGDPEARSQPGPASAQPNRSSPQDPTENLQDPTTPVGSAEDPSSTDDGETRIEEAPAAEPKIISPLPPPRPDPFSDIVKLQCRLELPSVTSGTDNIPGSGQINSKEKPLAKLFVSDVKECELIVRGSELKKPRVGGECKLLKMDDTSGERKWRKWTLITEVAENRLITPTPWGVFQLKDNALSFQWKGTPPIRLRFCRLDITVGDRTESCWLNQVKTVSPAQLDIKGPFSIPLDGLKELWREGDPLRIEIGFQGLSHQILVNNKIEYVMKLTDKAVIILRNPDAEENTDVTVQLTLEEPDGGKKSIPQLRAELLALKLVPSSNGATDSPPMTIAVGELESLKKDVAKKLADYINVTRNTNGSFRLSEWTNLAPNERERAIKLQELRNKHNALVSAKLPYTVEAEKVNKEIATLKEKENAEANATAFKLADPTFLPIAKESDALQLFKDRNDGWCDAMKTFLEKELGPQGRLHYRVYLDFDDDQFDIVKTEGFPGKTQR